MRTPPLALLVALAAWPAAGGCGAPRGADAGAGRPGETRLGSRAGWDATLLFEAPGDGVWGVGAHQVFAHYGTPEVVALDQQGRAWVLAASGAGWTPHRAVQDPGWLGALAQGEVDPRVEGPELYVAGERGNVYQVVGHEDDLLDARLVARLHGYRVHVLLAGELDEAHEGPELLAFVEPGGVCRLVPNAERADFDVEWISDLTGRVRDAVPLPSLARVAPWIALASGAGRVELLRLAREGPQWEPVHVEPTGFSAVALRPLALGLEAVLYAASDDGRVLRHARDEQGRWSTRTLYAGPPGPRGLVAERLSDDPARECVAVFGHGGEVTLLEAGADGGAEEGGEAWSATAIFRAADRGYRLELAELDGRNGTPELLCAGYAGRVVALSRAPGYGLRGVLTAPRSDLREP